MDINKFTEAARYMSIIEGYKRDLELLERECNPAKIVLFKDGGMVKIKKIKNGVYITNMHLTLAVETFACFGIEEGNCGYVYKHFARIGVLILV